MELFLTIAGVLVWIVTSLLVAFWAFGIRSRTKSGLGVQPTTAVMAACFAISLAVATWIRAPLHLLWMIPASFLLGFFPALHFLGAMYASIVNTGLDMNRANMKREVIGEFGKLLLHGTSAEDALRSICDKYPELVQEIGVEPFKEEAEFVAGLQRMSR